MIIEIDVPVTTKAISVTVVYEKPPYEYNSLTSRCFSVVDGVVTDENGSNKVVRKEAAVTNDL